MSIRKIAFLIVAMGLWVGSLTGVRGGAPVEMRWTETPIEYMSLVRALERIDRPVRAAIWGVKTTDKRTVATYTGDSLLLVGDWMRTGSAATCAVSQSTALSLWGSADAAGLPIALNGRDYVVGGVYESGVADVLIAWDGMEEAPFRQIALQFPGEPDGAQRQLALDFAALLGMDAPDEVLDAALLCGVARAVAQLPGWLLICLVLFIGWRALGGVTIMHLPVRLPVAILSLMGLVWAMGVSLVPPRWLLPSRWSDFAHWEKLAGEIGRRIADFLRAAHNPLNSHDLFACVRTSATGLLSALILYEIRGGWNHAQNMDRTSARHRRML
ncbi:MAG: hypothetical protein RSC06_11760 [Clostridia bacterium]